MRHSINCNERRLESWVCHDEEGAEESSKCVRLMLSGCLDPVWTCSTDVLLKGSFSCKLASWCYSWWERTPYYQEVIGCTTSHCANMRVISAPKVMCSVSFVEASNNTSASNYICHFHKVNYNEIISKKISDLSFQLKYLKTPSIMLILYLTGPIKVPATRIE